MQLLIPSSIERKKKLIAHWSMWISRWLLFNKVLMILSSQQWQWPSMRQEEKKTKKSVRSMEKCHKLKLRAESMIRISRSSSTHRKISRETKWTPSREFVFSFYIQFIRWDKHFSDSSKMNRSIAGFCSIILLYFLIISLFCPPVQPAQSIALSNLCGQFGHSCFGGKNYSHIDRSDEKFSVS